MAIVTISYQIGSGGREIGQAAAERLGYRCVGSEMIVEAAHRYGLSEERLERLGESKPPLLERLSRETRLYIAAIQSALYEFAAHDNTILLGRGGQWLLRAVPHVVRVRVIAPLDSRVERLAGRLSGEAGETTNAAAARAAALDLARRDDAEKSGRMRYLYEREIDDPLVYDLVLNTEKLSIDMAVDAVASVVGRPELSATAAGRQLVADQVLAARVHVALAADPRTRGVRATVESHSGMVSVTLSDPPADIETVVRSVDGVREVKVEPLEIPPLPPFVA
jgi:cytidylate kinase